MDGMSNSPCDNYEGRFVFIEHSNKDQKYYNGEYLCFRQTKATLYCVKASVGYEGSHIKQFPIMGTDVVSIVEHWEDREQACEFARKQMAWGKQAQDPCFKRQWVDTVYSGAIDVASQVMRCLEKKRGSKSVCEPNPCDDMGPRYIAIVGEDWNSMLGNDRAKFLRPKVGIFLHGGGDSLRESMTNMQVISGNPDMAIYPLQQIMEAMAENLSETARVNPRYRGALSEIRDAIRYVGRLEDAIAEARK